MESATSTTGVVHHQAGRSRLLRMRNVRRAPSYLADHHHHHNHPSGPVVNLSRSNSASTFYVQLPKVHQNHVSCVTESDTSGCESGSTHAHSKRRITQQAAAISSEHNSIVVIARTAPTPAYPSFQLRLNLVEEEEWGTREVLFCVFV